MKVLLVTAGLAVLLTLGLGGVALAETEAQMIQTHMLAPHHSEMTGDMVVQLRKTYGVPCVVTLVILAAETSLGDPRYGGRLVTDGHHNYGCMRYGILPKVTQLADGKAVVGGKSWYSFESPCVGMAAWGRYIKLGTSKRPGIYARLLFGAVRDWAGYADIYYGSGVVGIEAYKTRLLKLEASYVKTAKAHGFTW